MSKAIQNLEMAQKRALAIRPKVGGFPYLAETLRRAGVTRNFWFLPACESLFLDQGRASRDPRLAVSNWHDGRAPTQPRGADFGVADGSGRGKHVPRIPRGFVERRRCEVRRRSHCANGRILRLQWRGYY